MPILSAMDNFYRISNWQQACLLLGSFGLATDHCPRTTRVAAMTSAPDPGASRLAIVDLDTVEILKSSNREQWSPATHLLIPRWAGSLLLISILLITSIILGFLFLVTTAVPSPGLRVASGAAIIAGSLGMVYLAWGIRRRARLVYHFKTTALELIILAKHVDETSTVSLEGEWFIEPPSKGSDTYLMSVENPFDPREALRRPALIALIRLYQIALGRIGAYSEAEAVGIQVRDLRYPGEHHIGDAS
jgi:hypothetical protein